MPTFLTPLRCGSTVSWLGGAPWLAVMLTWSWSLNDCLLVLFPSCLLSPFSLRCRPHLLDKLLLLFLLDRLGFHLQLYFWGKKDSKGSECPHLTPMTVALLQTHCPFSDLCPPSWGLTQFTVCVRKNLFHLDLKPKGRLPLMIAFPPEGGHSIYASG